MKKNTYDDENELFNDIHKDINDVLQKEVMDEVKMIEMYYIKHDVLNSYSPKIYNRRSSGGIDDESNIQGRLVADMELEVDNVTRFSGGYGTHNSGVGLADLINEGDGSGGYYYDYAGNFNRARPFLDHTLEDVENTNAIDITLEKGLKKRGYELK
jgi:hypothetical protein